MAPFWKTISKLDFISCSQLYIYSSMQIVILAYGCDLGHLMPFKTLMAYAFCTESASLHLTQSCSIRLPIGCTCAFIQSDQAGLGHPIHFCQNGCIFKLNTAKSPRQRRLQRNKVKPNTICLLRMYSSILYWFITATSNSYNYSFFYERSSHRLCLLKYALHSDIIFKRPCNVTMIRSNTLLH